MVSKRTSARVSTVLWSRPFFLLGVGALCACGSSNGKGDDVSQGAGGSAAKEGHTASAGGAYGGGAPGSGGRTASVGGTTGTGVTAGSGGSAAGGTGSAGAMVGSGGASAVGSGGDGGQTAASGSAATGGATVGSGGATGRGGGPGGRTSTGGQTSAGGSGGAGGTAVGGATGASGGTGGAAGTGGQNSTGGLAGTDIWNLPKFPVAAGAYSADWKALGLAYVAPQWWRDAKFGAWAHWDPQSMPEQGDWYALRMYQQGSAQYDYHVSHFGDPSEYGYKEICRDWVIDQWDPNALMDLYVQMGAKFFMAMGSHHDNFDNFDSAYQPWNSVKVGVKKDIVGTWAPIAREKGLRFGIGFHNTPARTYGQWMPARYTNGAKGPFDALLTKADGQGQWWEGLDPVDLYGPKHSGDCANQSCNNSAFGTQFMYRVDDAINKYHPDVVYFDDHAGDSQVDLGVHMGLGAIAPTIVANYYNRSLTWKQGPVDVVMNMKGVGGQYNSFQNS
ncbi:MAG: alpha-L-fucosidase, partial [Polyangiaceae bacterium]|nr:alpha-L-fucosidase [Polyangiaceae bacterium]